MGVTIEDKGTHIAFTITSGVFIRDGVRDLSEKLETYKREGKCCFLVDFSKCDYISSEGMGAMADLWKYTRSVPHGKMAILFNADPENEVHFLFDTIGLSAVMKKAIFTSLAEAEKIFLPGNE